MKLLSAVETGRYDTRPTAQNQALGSNVLIHHLLLLTFVAVIVLINPHGYMGGGWDDGRYLAAAADWASHAPVLGANHWSLRWPVVLPAAAIIHFYGMSAWPLMIPGIIALTGLVLVNYWAVRTVSNPRAALIAGLAIAATPGFAYWATTIYPDNLEALLWSAALWPVWFASQRHDRRGQMRWLALSGVATGLAVGIRETSLGLVLIIAVAAWRMRAIDRRAWLAWAACGLPLPLIEHLSLWFASGEPFYRVRVDLNHVNIASEDMRGGVAHSDVAPLNVSIMERWSGAGPVHLHWLVDPYINLFVNMTYGLNFVTAAVLLFMARRPAGPFAQPPIKRGLLQALLVVAVVNLLINIYLLALNPAPRMFVPATVAAAIATGLLADRLWSRKVMRLVVAAMAVKILSTLIITDVAPDFTPAGRVAPVLAPRVGALHVDWVANAHFAFAPASIRQRLDLRPAPIGGYQLVVSNPTAGEALAGVPDGRWRMIGAVSGGHNPWIVRLLAPIVQGAGFMRDFEYPDMRVFLLQRLPDKGPPVPGQLLRSSAISSKA
jgi:4-amino-4-deoxy-L-arabinose transferase-like glycosyltransferase